MAPAIELSGVGRAYGERTALAGITLTLEPGRTLAVFGANGAGKTTLLRILATLLRPHAGSTRVFGRELSARENLRFHARLHRVAEARVETLLDQVGLRRRADEPVRTLSRGMAQRVAICRASLHGPELLLLDEPLANLDPGAAEAVDPLIGRTAGPARVVISHDVEHGLAEADLVLGLEGGRAVICEPVAGVSAADVRGLY